MEAPQKWTRIKGALWTISLLSNEAYNLKHGDDSIAITTMRLKEIDFQPGYFTEASIIHELFHAYFTEHNLNDLEVDGHQAEEMGAVIICTYGREIFRKAKQIHKFLTKHAGPQNAQMLLETHCHRLTVLRPQ